MRIIKIKLCFRRLYTKTDLSERHVSKNRIRNDSYAICVRNITHVQTLINTKINKLAILFLVNISFCELFMS